MTIDRRLQGVTGLGLALHGIPTEEDMGEGLGPLMLLEQAE
jgi:hypothetical protein